MLERLPDSCSPAGLHLVRGTAREGHGKHRAIRARCQPWPRVETAGWMGPRARGPIHAGAATARRGSGPSCVRGCLSDPWRSRAGRSCRCATGAASCPASPCGPCRRSRRTVAVHSREAGGIRAGDLDLQRLAGLVPARLRASSRRSSAPSCRRSPPAAAGWTGGAGVGHRTGSRSGVGIGSGVTSGSGAGSASADRDAVADAGADVALRVARRTSTEITSPASPCPAGERSKVCRWRRRRPCR